MWAVRVRNADLSVGEQVPFSSLSLVERYNQPDTCVVQGRVVDLAPLMLPGKGALLYDGGTQRVSCVVTGIVRSGDRTAQVTLTSDLVRLWDRVCYPNPAQAFNAQTRAYDVRTGAAETVAAAFIEFNAGPSALGARQVPGLRVATSAGRGPVTTVSARLDNVGQLVARLCESAGLRLRVVHTFSSTLGPRLVVQFEDAPNLSAWARYGTPSSGGPGLLSQDWSYSLEAPTVTRAEVAAGGEGAARIFVERASTDAESLWGRRVESMVDQRQTTDTSEIATAGDDAIREGAGPTSLAVGITNSPGLQIGVDVPIGSVVAATLDGVRVTERIREVTTTVSAGGSDPTVTVEPVFGSPDSTGLTKTQRELVKALRRISVIERTL